MQVPALPLDHPLIKRVERSARHELVERHDDDAMLMILIEGIKLSHEGDEKNFRPFVRIKGEILGIKPTKRLPGAVSEIAYPEGSGLSVDVRCEFSDEQIMTMITDGYFEPGYDFVDGVVGESLILNAPVDFKISRAYEGEELDTPVVFVDVPERTNLNYEPDMSGYDFTEYLKVPEKQLDLERVAEKSFDVEHDIFAELHDQFEVEGGVEPTFDAVAGPSVTTTDEFDRAREDVVRRMEADAPRVEPEVPEDERLFREQVAGSLDELMASKKSVAREHELSEDEDLFMQQQETRRRLSSQTIDLGAAGSVLGVEPAPEREVEPVSEISVSVDAAMETLPEDDDWLFSQDAADEDEDELDRRESPESEAGQPFDPHARHDEADASDPESSESQSRVAKLLAEHAERERRAAEAHREGLREEDLRPEV